MDRTTFLRMVDKAVSIIRDDWKLPSVTLVSGGAPGADQIAVQLFLTRQYQGLRLHLPAKLERNRFETKSPPGKRLNELHESFQRETTVASLSDLTIASRSQNATVAVHPGGFKGRNNHIAADCDYAIAFGWTPGDEPNPRTGTGHTWSKLPETVEKRYVCINTLCPRPADDLF